MSSVCDCLDEDLQGEIRYCVDCEKCAHCHEPIEKEEAEAEGYEIITTVCSWCNYG